MNTNKITFFFLSLVFVIMFASCGNKTASSSEQVDVDTVAFVEDTLEIYDDDYTSLGYIPCYYFDDVEEKYVTVESATLYVKIVNDREYFYLAIDEDETNRKYPVEKCSVNVNSHDCNEPVDQSK